MNKMFVYLYCTKKGVALSPKLAPPKFNKLENINLMNFLQISTTIHPDRVNNEEIFAQYDDFINHTFDFYFRVENSSDITIDVGFGDNYVIAEGGEELELVAIYDEDGNEVDMDIDDYCLENIYMENLEDGVLAPLPVVESFPVDSAPMPGVPDTPRPIFKGGAEGILANAIRWYELEQAS